MALALGATFALTSCSDPESEGKSRITYYAMLELNGDAYVTSQLGDAYNELGCTATMAGEDVTEKVVTTGTVDTNRLGFYKINYSVVNDDGFPASASRTVAVVDRKNFASTYYGESQFGSRHYFNAPIYITDNGDGTYTIDDLGGGLYFFGRYPGYEPTYDFHLEAKLKLNADNTIEVTEQGSWFWGDTFTINSASYDPETGTVKFVMDFDGAYTVTLTK